MSLNQQQQKAYDIICAGQNLSLSGPAGTGKSYLVKKFIENYTGLRTIHIAASTGIAATLIDGTTVHSFFGIGIAEGTTADLINKVRKDRSARERLGTVDTLFIDEISMISGKLLDILDIILQTIRRCDKPFGGVQTILIGDFAQLPPVNWQEDGFAFQAKCWAELIGNNKIELVEVIRQKDKLFIDILNTIRRGDQLSAEQVNILENCKINRPPPIEGLEPVSIEPYRADVDRINMDYLKKLLRETKATPFVFEATHSIHGPNMAINIEAAYNRTTLTKKLYIAIGAQVMLIKNLDVVGGLCNGSRGIVRDIIMNNGVAIGCTVQFIGRTLQVFAETWKIRVNDTVVNIKQIPLILAAAISSHKSQGSSIDYAKVNAMFSFEYGQTYCMLSRVRSLEGLIIEDIDYEKIKCHPLVKKFYDW